MNVCILDLAKQGIKLLATSASDFKVAKHRKLKFFDVNKKAI